MSEIDTTGFEYKPTHRCKKHGDVFTMSFSVDSKKIGTYCIQCLNDLLASKLDEPEEIK